MSRRVVIIGGGVIGLSAALACAGRGHRVTVLEQDAGCRGASLGNAGMVVPSHFVPLAAPGMVSLALKWMWNPESPFYLKPRLDAGLLAWCLRFWRAATPAHVKRAAPLLRDLHLASREEFVRLEQESDGFGLVQRGLLMLCRTAKALDHEARTAESARALGVPARVLDARATAAADPGVTMDVAGSVLFPRDCHLDPGRFVAALERRITAAGGIIRSDVAATGLRREGRGIAAVQTSQGDVEGDDFVLAGGAWSPALARTAGLRIPMEAGKGYSLTLTSPVQLPQLCSILAEARVAVTPMGNSLRFGGTMEFSGLNRTIHPRRITGIVRAVPEYFPAFRPEHFADVPPWCGMRPCSPDGLPYLGRTAAAANLIVATGHAMMGVSLAPVTGRIVARLVDGEPPGFDLSLLSPDRFA